MRQDHHSQFTCLPLFDFSPGLRAIKLAYCNLWRVGWVRRQGLSAVRDHPKSRYSLSNRSIKQSSVTIRNSEHQVQGGVKFGQLKGSSSGKNLIRGPGSSSVRAGNITLDGHHSFSGYQSGGNCERNDFDIACG